VGKRKKRRGLKSSGEVTLKVLDRPDPEFERFRDQRVKIGGGGGGKGQSTCKISSTGQFRSSDESLENDLRHVEEVKTRRGGGRGRKEKRLYREKKWYRIHCWRAAINGPRNKRKLRTKKRVKK